MALQQPYTDPDRDQSWPNAYRRIAGVHQTYALDSSNGTPRLAPVGKIDVAIFAGGSTAGKALKFPGAFKEFPLAGAATRLVFGMQQPTPSAVIPTARAYAYLKTLPEYAGAVDV